MKEFPEKFEELFVPSNKSKIAPSTVVNVLEFPEVLNECETTIANNMQQFLFNADHPLLQMFLIFTTIERRHSERKWRSTRSAADFEMFKRKRIL